MFRFSSRVIDRFLLAAGMAGVAILLYIAGCALLYFRYSDSTPLDDAFDAASAWYWEWKQGNVNNFSDQINVTPEYMARMDAVMSSAQISADESSKNGYVLVTVDNASTVYLLDMQGHIAHRWDLPFATIWNNPSHIHQMVRTRIVPETAYAYPNGDLLVQYGGIDDTPYGYGLAKMDKNSHLLWSYAQNAHHDFYVDPHSGEIYALIQELVKERQPGYEALRYPSLFDYIVKLSPQGKVLDRFSISDALMRSGHPELVFFDFYRRRKYAWDPLHTNSIEKLEPELADKFPMFKAGDLLISMRTHSAVLVIDPATRQIKWTAIGQWKQQHAARFMNNGHIVMFDNKGITQGLWHTSSIIEIDPATNNVVWLYGDKQEDRFFSHVRGRVQPLKNGDLFVASSDENHLFELTHNGTIVWDFRLPIIQDGNFVLQTILSVRHYEPDQLPFLKQESSQP